MRLHGHRFRGRHQPEHGYAYLNLKDVDGGLPAVIDEAAFLSGGDLHAGMITFDNYIDVNAPLTSNWQAVRDTLVHLPFSGDSDSDYEASDEALHEMLSDASPECTVEGDDFTDGGAFREECVKHAILITDYSPGGCDGLFDESDIANAYARALEAADSDIIVTAVYLGGGPEP